MRAIALGGCLVLLAACAKPDQQAARDSAGAGASAPLTLEQLVGTWAFEVRSATTDSLLVTYTLTASSDPAGWTFSFPDGSPTSYDDVRAEGDSVVLDAGPYPSVLRKGIQVSTHTVLRLQSGELVGTSIAHYATSTPDSVLTGNLRGTRVQ